MAAVELKKKNWKFNKKFVTWFKKDGPENANLTASAFNINRKQSTVQGNGSNASGTEAVPGKDVGKYVFFDFENGWQQRVSDDIEMDLSQIENELNVAPMQQSVAPTSAQARPNQ